MEVTVLAKQQIPLKSSDLSPAGLRSYRHHRTCFCSAFSVNPFTYFLSEMLIITVMPAYSGSVENTALLQLGHTDLLWDFPARSSKQASLHIRTLGGGQSKSLNPAGKAVSGTQREGAGSTWISDHCCPLLAGHVLLVFG